MIRYLHAHRDGLVYATVLLGCLILVLTSIAWADVIDQWTMCK